jgi:hypothetical protein
LSHVHPSHNPPVSFKFFNAHFSAGLMVNDGFVSHDTKNDKPLKGLAPPTSWNRQHEHEWIITYTRKGALNRFRLHCSLQAATDRLFVHASELTLDGEPMADNIQVMGLQMGNYVDLEACKESTWEGVVKNVRTLTEMFSEFVLAPLWLRAEKGEAAEGIKGLAAVGPVLETCHSYAASLKTRAVALRDGAAAYVGNPKVAVPLAVGVAAVAVGAFLLLKPKTPLVA